MRRPIDNKNPVSIALRRDKEDIMKKALILAMMLMIIAAAGSAFAADTYTLTVQATVFGTCRFSVPNSSTLVLPNITFDATGNSTASNGSTVITYWCTKGTAPALTEQSTLTDFTAAPQAFVRNLTNVDSFPYTLTLTNGGRNLNDPPAILSNITIDAVVAAGAANAVDAAAGGTLYQDTVLIDVNP